MNTHPANTIFRALRSLAAPKPVPFAALSDRDRYALILHVQMAVRPSHEPLTAREAERAIEQLTDVGYARLIEAWRRA